MSLTGDATGGLNTITVNFDPRYSGVCSYVRVARQSAASIEMQLTLLPAPPRNTPQAQAFFNATPLNSISGNNLGTWCPPPLPHFRQLKSAVPNSDTLIHTLFVYVYNFDIRAFEKVPLATILASLPRADSQFPTTAS